MDLFEWAEKASTKTVNTPRGRPEIRNEEGKRRTMIERLAAGSLSTFECERLVHRGQAVIGSLRAEGHRIDLEKIDGVDCYVYRGKVSLVKVTPALQEQYYATPHWKTLAAARKEHDGYACCQCGATEELETHHWRYHLFAENMKLDLMTFCRSCHQAIHQACKGSTIIHFPRQISEELARQIETNYVEQQTSN